MFWRITWFEISYWLRSKMLWVFFGVIALMVFAAVSTSDVRLFIVLTNTHHNAPFVISAYYAFISLIMLLMAAAFVNSAALRMDPTGAVSADTHSRHAGECSFRHHHAGWGPELPAGADV